MEEELLGSSEKQPYLSFKIGEEDFAVQVSQVREIIELFPITKIPHSPDYLKGIINLRGNIVPVVDMRIKFDLEEFSDTKKTRIVIFDIDRNDLDETQVLGGIVDQTHDVLSFGKEELQKSPAIDDHEKADFIKGVFKHEEKFILLLDINKVLSRKELLDIIQSEEDTELLSK